MYSTHYYQYNTKTMRLVVLNRTIQWLLPADWGLLVGGLRLARLCWIKLEFRHEELWVWRKKLLQPREFPPVQSRLPGRYKSSVQRDERPTSQHAQIASDWWPDPEKSAEIKYEQVRIYGLLSPESVVSFVAQPYSVCSVFATKSRRVLYPHQKPTLTYTWHDVICREKYNENTYGRKASFWMESLLEYSSWVKNVRIWCSNIRASRPRMIRAKSEDCSNLDSSVGEKCSNHMLEYSSNRFLIRTLFKANHIVQPKGNHSKILFFFNSGWTD